MLVSRNFGGGPCHENMALLFRYRFGPLTSSQWRCYLEEVSADVLTVVPDHNPLTYLQTQAVLSRRQTRWSEMPASEPSSDSSDKETAPVSDLSHYEKCCCLWEGSCISG